MLINRFNSKLYVAYSIFYILGTIFAIQVSSSQSIVRFRSSASRLSEVPSIWPLTESS